MAGDERAVARASADVAWLRMETADEMADVRLALGGEDRLIARARYHGDPDRLAGLVP